MKKKATSKSKLALGPTRQGGKGSPAKAASKKASPAKASAAKGGKSAKAGKASKAAKPPKATQAKAAKSGKASGKAAGTAKKTTLAATKKAAPATAKKAAPAATKKAAPKPAAAKKSDPAKKSAPAASKAPAPKAKPLPKAQPIPLALPVAKILPVIKEPDLETQSVGTPKAKAGVVSTEEEGALRNVMASLTNIFGGRDFISDAELDALLDDKMASGEIPPSAALDPLDEAQSLVYEAWNSEGPQRIRLAHRALETSPDCADAYVILAEEEAKDRREALELFRKGLEAGERALDPALFHKSAGKFWEIMETRPYMRARLGLAESLWEFGKKDEALGHLRDLLRLNPHDNQGVRYILAQVLLETGAEGELGDLLDRFRGDMSPQIRFTHALWMFRHEGPGRKADALLAEAVKANPHVPAYLLKRKKPPKEAPDHAEAGSEEEAAAYAMGAVDSWHRTLGAADWLAGLAEKTR